MTGVKCEFDNEYFINGACVVRAVRGKLGFLNLNYTTVKDIHELFFTAQLYHKYGTKYRQFLIDFKLDICEMFSKNTQKNTLQKFISLAISKFNPALLHPCPFVKGNVSVSASADEVLTALYNTFKFIVPAGDQKWVITLGDYKKHKYLRYEAKTTIMALNGADMSMLSMG